MKLDTVLTRIPIWYEQRRCIYLKSAPGLGKTTTLTEAPRVIKEATGKNLGMVVINGGLLNEMDAIGYLVPKHFETHSESRYTLPFWWVTDEKKHLDEYDGGIILIDEADKMPVEAKKVIGEAALSGRLGPHRFPVNDGRRSWVVWMAGNRSADRSGSTKELDHLINRRREITIEPDLVSLTNWMTKNGCLDVSVAFANTFPDIVLNSEVPKVQAPWCTPRSLVECDRSLQIACSDTNNLKLDPTLMEEIAGDIGEGAGLQFYNSLRLAQEAPKYEAIVANPDKAKVPDAPDALMLIAFRLAARVAAEDASQVIKYVERMPKEYSVCFTRGAIARCNALISTPAFASWCMRNSHLVTMIANKRS